MSITDGEATAAAVSAHGGRAAWAGTTKAERTERMRAIALLRWAGTSRRRRSAYGRLAALARWGEKKRS